MASLADFDFCSCAPLVLAGGSTRVGFAHVVFPFVLKHFRPHFFAFLESLPGASVGAGGELHVSPQMATRLVFGSCRLGPTNADGAWRLFASTPTAEFIIKFFNAAGERPVFDVAQLSGINAAGQARILDLIYDRDR
jgi:hypothetical protein